MNHFGKSALRHTQESGDRALVDERFFERELAALDIGQLVHFDPPIGSRRIIKAENGEAFTDQLN
jgi:hypothetical protein